MYNKERTSFEVTNVCGPKAIFSSTLFRNLIFTPVHLYNKLMDPDLRQIRTEASTALAVVMRKVLGEKWCKLSDKTMSFIRCVGTCSIRQMGSPVWFSLTFWHRSFTFNSNKSPTWCRNFSVYYPDVCLQLNIFRAFSALRQELDDCSGSLWFYLCIVVIVVLCLWLGRPNHEHTNITTIRR